MMPKTREFSSMSRCRGPWRRGVARQNRLPLPGGEATLFAPQGGRAVPSTIEARKAALVGEAQQLAGREGAVPTSALLRRFIAEFYEHAPPSDVAARSAADLYGGALALWRFAAGRPSGSAKV